MRQKKVQLVCFSIFLLSFLGGDIAIAFLSSDSRIHYTDIADNSAETEDTLEDENEVKFSYLRTMQTPPHEQASAPEISDERTGNKHPFIEIHSPPPE